MTPPETRTYSRVLMYSHDTMGLGHLRRCRAIAHALVEADSNVSVLILSGSPIIGSFDFRTRVDFVRIPGVIKLRNGDYTSLSLPLDIEDTVRLRSAIIEHTAETFDPDLFIVDKEPWGLRGEVRVTLENLKAKGTPLALGLRDVMDEPELLESEWERKKVLPALESLYDEIWVYGVKQVCDPFEGLDMPAAVRMKTRYTGYLRRSAANTPSPAPSLPFTDEPFLLVTAGGGGDGDGMMDWVLRAYETDRELPYPALLVLGPFMPNEIQHDLIERAARLDRVHAITFDSHIEGLMARCAGIVAMGGYNTFCEILSFDKRALILPRTEPRLEQFIRAKRAEELGLLRVLVDEGDRDPMAMSAALRRLPGQKRPSEVASPALLDGLTRVSELAARRITRRRRAATPLRRPHVA